MRRSKFEELLGGRSISILLVHEWLESALIAIFAPLGIGCDVIGLEGQ